MKLLKMMALPFFTLALITASCSEYEYTPDPDFEKADISAISCYDRSGADVIRTSEIILPMHMVIVMLRPGADITDLKVSITVSSGATVTPSLSTGFGNWTAPRIVNVTSPAGTVTEEWTIMIYPSN